jgi:hypothetical protein
VRAAAASALARTLREPEQTAARTARAFERAQALFGLDAYLDSQEGFMRDALAALGPTAPRGERHGAATRGRETTHDREMLTNRNGDERPCLGEGISRHPQSS